MKDLRYIQSRAADDVRDMRADMNKLKEELSKRPSEKEFMKRKEDLARRPSEEEVLRTFRASEDYFSELNEKAAEKIFVTWEVASKFLVENPGGNFEEFIPVYMAEEEKIFSQTHVDLGFVPEISVPALVVDPYVSQPTTTPKTSVPPPPPDSAYVAPPPPPAT